jgi:O-methyltransferase involved in polyketide biosynthesis
MRGSGVYDTAASRRRPPQPGASPMPTSALAAARAAPSTMSVDRLGALPDGFDAVARTLLIPLAARAHGDAMFPALAVGDDHAARLVAHLGVDVSPFLADRHSVCGVLSRTRLMRTAAQAFFDRHPEATGIALGAGLSHYHQWLDNGSNRWIDIDRAAVVALRQRWLPAAPPRRLNRVADLAQADWWQRAGLPLDRNGAPLLLLAEGVLMYLEPGQVQRLLWLIGEHAPPGSLLLADCFGSHMVGLEAWHPSVRRTAAHFRWGLQAAEDLAQPHRRLQLVAEQPVMDAMGAAEAYAARWFRFVTGVPFYSVYLLGVGRDPNEEGP